MSAALECILDSLKTYDATFFRQVTTVGLLVHEVSHHTEGLTHSHRLIRLAYFQHKGKKKACLTTCSRHLNGV